MQAKTQISWTNWNQNQTKTCLQGRCGLWVSHLWSLASEDRMMKESRAQDVADTAAMSPRPKGPHGPTEWTTRQQSIPIAEDRMRPRHNTLAVSKTPEPWPTLWTLWGKPWKTKTKLSQQHGGMVAQNRNYVEMPKTSSVPFFSPLSSRVELYTFRVADRNSFCPGVCASSVGLCKQPPTAAHSLLSSCKTLGANVELIQVHRALPH